MAHFRDRHQTNTAAKLSEKNAGMAKQPLQLPPAVAKSFLKDMRAFLAEPDSIKADEIAARQLEVLRGYQGPREKKLRLSDVKRMFWEMRGEV